MGRITSISLILMLVSAPVYSQEAPKSNRRGTGAGYGTRDATVLSMMGWGAGLALGIAILCGSLSQSTSGSSDNGGGNNNH